jgi:hypothetical protein
MKTYQDAISVAKTQVGYHEGKTGTHWNNIQHFAPSIGFTQGLAWCATFVQFLYWLTGTAVPTGAKSASCAAAVKAYKAAGRWTEYPVTGAQIFFGPGGGTHCGIVTGWDDTHVFTIEGNTNTTGSPEGDGVYVKTRTRRDTYVYGYGVPYFDSEGASPDPKWHGRDLSK